MRVLLLTNKVMNNDLNPDTSKNNDNTWAILRKDNLTLEIYFARSRHSADLRNFS